MALGVAAFSLALVVAILPLPYVGLAVRGLALLSVMPGAFVLLRGLRRTEAWWFTIILLYLLGTFVSALYALDIGAASVDFARQVYVVSISLLLALCLRNRTARIVFSYGMTFLAAAVSVLIIALYLLYVGPSFGGLENVRAFKFEVFNSLNIALNPLSFAMILAFLLAYPAWSRHRRLGFPLIGLVSVGMVLSGSRAALVTTLISVLVVALIGVIRSRNPLLRWGGYCSLVLGTIVGSIYLPPLWENFLDPDQLGELSAGRWELWSAALAKFAEYPLTGWGAGSWQVNLASYLPVYDISRFRAITSLESGSFHNAYLAILAEKGLVVFGAGLVMVAFLIRQSWRLHEGKAFLAGTDRAFATVAPLVVVLMLVRALVEQPGLLGSANGLVDYLAYAAAALIVATATQLHRLERPKAGRPRR